MSQILNDNTVRQIAEIAAKQGAEAVAKAINAYRDDARKRIISDTKRSLSAYRAIKAKLSEEAQFTNEEKAEIRWRFLEDIVTVKPHTDHVPENIILEAERLRRENLYFIHEIETALRIFKEECEASGNEEQKRRYRELYDRYIAGKPLSVLRIADKEHIAEKTVYKDLNIAVGVMAVILHGFRAVQAGLEIE